MRTRKLFQLIAIAVMLTMAACNEESIPAQVDDAGMVSRLESVRLLDCEPTSGLNPSPGSQWYAGRWSFDGDVDVEALRVLAIGASGGPPDGRCSSAVRDVVELHVSDGSRPPLGTEPRVSFNRASEGDGSGDILRVYDDFDPIRVREGQFFYAMMLAERLVDSEAEAGFRSLCLPMCPDTGSVFEELSWAASEDPPESWITLSEDLDDVQHALDMEIDIRRVP